MGSPDIWYKACLKNFAKNLSEQNYYKDIEQMSETELEIYISKKRLETSEPTFYYMAGIAADQTVRTAYKISCDDLNTAAGSLCMFEDFIELEPEIIN